MQAGDPEAAELGFCSKILLAFGVFGSFREQGGILILGVLIIRILLFSLGSSIFGSSLVCYVPVIQLIDIIDCAYYYYM